jgi:ferredoxin-nitrite reductase
MQKLKEISLSRSLKINKIEKLKYVKPINDFYEDLKAFCDGTKVLEEEDINFFLKCFGLFRKDDGSFMLRIRIPAGELSREGALAIGEISKLYGKNHIDITTRQQIELRFLALEHLYEIMARLDSVGISSFQTGIDNFRNIVTSSFVVAKKDSEIGFNLYLGGKVGVQGLDSGLFIATKDVISVYKAIINLFKEYGFRDNRNKNMSSFTTLWLPSFINTSNRQITIK